MNTDKPTQASVTDLTATPTKDACRMATSPQQLLPMLLAFMESFTGTVWEGQCEGSSYEEGEEWTTAQISLSFRVPSDVVIDEFADKG